MHGNNIDASKFEGFTAGILIDNVNSAIYNDIKINGNRINDSTTPIRVDETGLTLENVKIKGNPAFTDGKGPAIPNIES